MSTNFITSYTEGDVIVSSHSKQYADAVNNVEDGSAFWAEDSGSTDNYAATLATTLTSYTAGLFVHLKPNTNNVGVATLNLNSVGSNIIKKGDGTVDLDDGDLLADNVYLLVYNGSNFVLVSSLPSSATDGTSISFLAINGEAFTIKKGQPVKLFSTGNPPTVKLARADSGTNCACGLASADAATTATFSVVKLGLITQADWTDVIGSTNLTFNQEYWLGQGAAGVLDSSPPTGAGDIIHSLGKAFSDDDFYVNILDYYQI